MTSPVVVQPTDLAQVNLAAALFDEFFGSRAPAVAESAGCCAACGGALTAGVTTARFVRRRAGRLVVTSVPADLCGGCGRPYFSVATSRQLEQIDAAARGGGHVDFTTWARRLPFDLEQTA